MSLFLPYFDDELVNINSLYFSCNEYVFYLSCKNGNLELVKWILNFDYKIQISQNNELAFSIACEHNNIDIAKFLYEKNKNMDLYLNNKHIIYIIVEEGYIDLLKWLYKIFPDCIHSISIETQNELFRIACNMHQLEIAEYLYNLNNNIEINFENDLLFINCCENNYINFAHFLTSIRPDCYYIAVDDDKIIHFEICRSIQIKNEIKKSDCENINKCLICWEVESNVLTICGHMFCYECLDSHYEKNDKRCPYCRKENYEFELFRIID